MWGVNNDRMLLMQNAACHGFYFQNVICIYERSNYQTKRPAGNTGGTLIIRDLCSSPKEVYSNCRLNSSTISLNPATSSRSEATSSSSLTIRSSAACTRTRAGSGATS